MATRRDFLRRASMLAMGAMGTSKMSAAEKLTGNAVEYGRKHIGFQSYGLGSEMLENPAYALKEMKSYGYDYLELAFYYHGVLKGWNEGSSEIPVKDFKKMADDAGLKILSSHVTPENLVWGDKYDSKTQGKIVEYFKSICDDHAMMGCKYLVTPTRPPMTSTEDVKRAAEVFNAIGEETLKHGIMFGYHNHASEFSKVIPGGKEVIPFYRQVQGRGSHDLPKDPNAPQQRSWSNEAPSEYIEDLLMDNTDPKKVFFELDCFWTVMAQEDPVKWIQNRRERIRCLHVKDFMVIGSSGAMNYKNIFTNFYANGWTDFFVELEDINSGRQLERFRASANYLMGEDFVK